MIILASNFKNYLTLLTKLRAALGEEKLITAAVSSTPFEKNGKVLKDLSEFYTRMLNKDFYKYSQIVISSTFPLFE